MSFWNSVPDDLSRNMAPVALSPGPLAALARARRALERANTVPAIADIGNQAEALRMYARTVRLGLEAQNRRAELRLGAEWKAGRLIPELLRRGGDRARVTGNPVQLLVVGLEETPVPVRESVHQPLAHDRERRCEPRQRPACRAGSGGDAVAAALVGAVAQVNTRTAPDISRPSAVTDEQRRASALHRS